MKRVLIALMICSANMLNAQQKHVLPPLPYATNALEPVMSTETIEYHHGKHVQAYVDKLNELIPGTVYANATLEQITKTAENGIFNNGAQILNHMLFFDAFAPEATAKHVPTGKLAEAIDRSFGSFDEFKKKFAEAANGQFGSGWAWLTSDSSGNLRVMAMPNAGNPLRDGYKPLLGCDVWEHSYYIDYRNKRADYIDNFWRIVDWNVVEARYEQ